MKKTFVCLANSQKWGQRCIAGVEITDYDGNSYSIVQYGSQPKWIRPVSKSTHGEVPVRVVGRVQLLDVVELEMISECPQGYQSENILFDEKSLKVIGQVEWSSEKVAQFQHTGIAQLFGNRGKAVHIDAISHVTASLVLIKPTSVRFRWDTKSDGSTKLRATFLLEGIKYDLPVTDGNFQAKYYQNQQEAINFSEWYFTISLGVKLNDFHYKLIAAVFGF
jgi:hypothetical protein